MPTHPVVTDSIAALRSLVSTARARQERVALVPTMGYLHEGHLSLVQLAHQHAPFVVVSIYVNPTQFGPKEDLAAYPRDLAADLTALSSRQVSVIYTPTNATMYPDGFATSVKVSGLTEHLCGLSRPTHFQGVTTVVVKLFNQVQPDVAVFGEKDYQQLAVIRRMTRDLDLPVEIVAGSTIRELDGLAMSSRNVYLDPGQRSAAPALYRALLAVRRAFEDGERAGPALVHLARTTIEAHPELSVDYVELIHPDDLRILSHETSLSRPAHMVLAVYAGKTRLIDNLRVAV